MPITRKIVEIDQAKCNGCGLCVPSCAEGAIQIVDGKARLVADVYCDGLGACLGHCPQDAITITEREADAFDEEQVHKRLASLSDAVQAAPRTGCPGATVQDLRLQVLPTTSTASPASTTSTDPSAPPSTLGQWPVQLHLVPPQAPFLRDADLVLVADCVPLAFADFHSRLLRQRPLVIACPKLDDTRPYVDKLAAILSQSGVRSLTVIQMEVPCCTGLMRIAQEAAQHCARPVPIGQVVVSIRGQVVQQTEPMAD